MITLIWCSLCISFIANALTPNTLTSNSFIYKINAHRKLDEFIHAKNGYRLKSSTLQLQDLDFQLHFYPAGRFPHQENQFIVYLCINNLSNHNYVTSVFVDWNLFIHEINFSWITKDRHHADTAKCRGFVIENNAHILKPLNTLLTNKEHPLQALTFSVTVNIKRIFDGQHLIHNDLPIKIKKHNKLKWKIDNRHMLDEILLAQHQQTYVSRLYNDMFFLSLTPNGYHESSPDSLDMFLHVVLLPNEVSKLKMKCVFKISELKIVHDFDAEWTNNDKGWGWPQRKYTLKKLRAYAASSNWKQLTISAECETLAILDHDGKPLDLKKQWKDLKFEAKENKIHLPPQDAYVAALFEEIDIHNDDYCVSSSNVSHEVHFQHINEMLLDIAQDMDILRQQLFVTIGIFTMNFGATLLMFTALISLFCCGWF